MVFLFYFFRQLKMMNLARLVSDLHKSTCYLYTYKLQKNNMKKIIILSLFTAFYLNSVAQGPINGFKVGGGLSVVAPVGNLEGYSVGVGVDLLGQYGISSQFAITADAGYTTLFPKNKDAESFNIIPLRAGIRFYPSSKLYLGGKAGIAIMTMKDSDSQSNFAYSVGGGFRMDNKLDIGLSYDGSSLKSPATVLTPESSISFGYIGIRLGYMFN